MTNTEKEIKRLKQESEDYFEQAKLHFQKIKDMKEKK